MTPSPKPLRKIIRGWRAATRAGSRTAKRASSPYSNVRGVSAAAGLTTSVTDLARFAMFQLRTHGTPVRSTGVG